MSKKIPISTSHTPLAGNPFAALNPAGLPSGASADDLASPPEHPGKPGRIVLRRERSGRGGKEVIVVHGFADRHPETAIEAWARQARQACGCGGSVADRSIELQGGDTQRVRKFFEKLGFRVDGV